MKNDLSEASTQATTEFKQYLSELKAEGKVITMAGNMCKSPGAQGYPDFRRFRIALNPKAFESESAMVALRDEVRARLDTVVTKMVEFYAAIGNTKSKEDILGFSAEQPIDRLCFYTSSHAMDKLLKDMAKELKAVATGAQR